MLMFFMIVLMVAAMMFMYMSHSGHTSSSSIISCSRDTRMFHYIKRFLSVQIFIGVVMIAAFFIDARVRSSTDCIALSSSTMSVLLIMMARHMLYLIVKELAKVSHIHLHFFASTTVVLSYSVQSPVSSEHPAQRDSRQKVYLRPDGSIRILSG